MATKSDGSGSSRLPPPVVTAKNIIATAQFISQSVTQVSGAITCANGSTITIGGQKIYSEPGKLIAAGATITAGGLQLDGGLCFASAPDIIITGIARDIDARADDRAIPTAGAVARFIDARMRDTSVAFDTIIARQLAPPPGACAITIAGDAIIEGNIAARGAISYSTAHIRAPESYEIAHAIIFVSRGDDDAQIIDIRAPQASSDSDSNGSSNDVAALCAQFINRDSPPVILRFDCGCVSIGTDTALRIMRARVPRETINVCAMDPEWLCLEQSDAFFPMCATPIASEIIATSCAIDALGRVIVIGNSTDAGGRGCAHVFIRDGRPGAHEWARVVPKIVVGEMSGGGSRCAISADASTIAIAGTHSVWIFALLRAGTRVIWREITRARVAALELRLSYNGRVLLVARADGVAVYDIPNARAPTIVARREFANLRAPIAMSGDGSVCFALRAGDHGCDCIIREQINARDGSGDRATACDATPGAIESIHCDVAGANYAVNLAGASAHLATTISRTIDAITIAHAGASLARINMSADCVALSANGAVAIAITHARAAVIIY